MPCISGMGHEFFGWVHSQLRSTASKWHARHEWRNQRPRDPDTKKNTRRAQKPHWRIIRVLDAGWIFSYLPHVSPIPPNIDKGPWKSRVFLPKSKIGNFWVSETQQNDLLNRFLSRWNVRWDSKYESKFICRHQSSKFGCKVFWKAEISPKNDEFYFLIPTEGRFSSLMYVLTGS